MKAPKCNQIHVFGRQLVCLNDFAQCYECPPDVERGERNNDNMVRISRSHHHGEYTLQIRTFKSINSTEQPRNMVATVEITPNVLRQIVAFVEQDLASQQPRRTEHGAVLCGGEGNNGHDRGTVPGHAVPQAQGRLQACTR